MEDQIFLDMANEDGRNPGILQRAMEYLEHLKELDNGWELCIQRLMVPPTRPEEMTVLFHCLQVLEHFVKSGRYGRGGEAQQMILRQFLMRGWKGQGQDPSSTPITNKIAQIMSLVFVMDYPSRWPSFFDHLHLSTLTPPDITENGVGMYLKVLLAIDSEIADRDLTRSQAEQQRSSEIKDAMRDTVVRKLAETWYHILTAQSLVTNVRLMDAAMNVVGKYISWMDINLVANDNFVAAFVMHLRNPFVSSSAAECIHCILSKGMDPVAKANLIESFFEVLGSAGVWGLLRTPEWSKYSHNLAKIIETMGIQLLEGFNKVPKNDTGPQALVKRQMFLLRVEDKMPLALEILRLDKECACGLLLEFLRDYLHALKVLTGGGPISPSQKQLLRDLVELVTQKSMFFDDYDFQNEEEEAFQEYRRRLKIVFDGVCSVRKELVTEHVKNGVVGVVQKWRELSFKETEVGLLLMYYLGEGSTAVFNANLQNSSPIQQMMILLINSDIFTHPHSAVVLQFFENLVRYEKFFGLHPDFIPRALQSFLGEACGLFHPDKKVRSRTCCLFSRFVKTLRNHLTLPLSLQIIETIQPLLVLGPAPGQTEPPVCCEDQLYLFEVIGFVIISGGEKEGAKKAELMRQVMTPMLDATRAINMRLTVEEDYKQCEEMIKIINSAVSSTSRLSKAFSSQQTMKASHSVPIFLEALELFIHSVEVATPGELLEGLQDIVRQYLHRMVVCLEEELLPYVPRASTALLRNSNATKISEYLPLINQVINKFKLSWVFQRDVIPFLIQMFTPMVQEIFAELNHPFDPNDQIAKRERQLLQRSYYCFISTILQNNVSEVLSAPENMGILEQVIMTVIEGAIYFSDPLGQRACYSILRNFVELWAGNPPEPVQNGEGGGGPGDATGNLLRPFEFNLSMFLDFMWHNIVPACFLGPINPEFDLNDAQTVIALGEAATCLLAVKEKRGEELQAFLRFQYFRKIQLANPDIEEFIRALNGPPKQFKAYFKSFFRQYKVDVISPASSSS